MMIYAQAHVRRKYRSAIIIYFTAANVSVWKWVISKLAEIRLVQSEGLHYAIFKWNGMDSSSKHDSYDVCTCNSKCFSRLKINSEFSFFRSALSAADIRTHYYPVMVTFIASNNFIRIFLSFVIFHECTLHLHKIPKMANVDRPSTVGPSVPHSKRISSNMMDASNISCSKQFQTILTKTTHTQLPTTGAFEIFLTPFLISIRRLIEFCAYEATMQIYVNTIYIQFKRKCSDKNLSRAVGFWKW